jgi:hypothetical protein
MFGKKKSAKNSVSIDIAFEPKISRLFIFRCLWIPVIIIPLALYGIWFAILSFVHFWYMLVLGKRSRDIFDTQLEFIRFAGGWQAYMKYYVNEHPDILGMLK